jgi:perosamine synthetase
MAIARGSVQHTLPEDFRTLVSSVLMPGRCAARASLNEREALRVAAHARFHTPTAVAFPYARTGLHAVLSAMRLPRGSKVLMTPINVGPMLEVVASLGLQTEFVDIELESFGPDLESLNRKLQESPAVFVLTYLFGYVPNVSSIVSACADADVRLIEDFSHNIGSSWDGRPLGTFGDAGIFSASMLKYVDGYNGAFVIAREGQLGERIEAAAERLNAPSPRRIQGRILNSLVWNLALNRYVFNLATYPVLALIKAFSRQRFNELLGPSISLDLELDELPAFYFEDIASIQLRTILRHLGELDELLRIRHEAAMLAHDALVEVTASGAKWDFPHPNHVRAGQTFWQFPIRVDDAARVRDVLFRKKVETGTTNLMDLAEASGVSLPNTRALKAEYIFVPLHRHLRYRDYVRVFRALSSVG